MQLKPQRYTDATHAEALSSGCDIVQPKIRGVWVRLVVSRGFARVYDALGVEARPALEVDENVCCTLIGNCLHTIPDQPIVLWDCWEIGDVNGERPVYNNVEGYSYRDRFGFLKVQHKALGSPHLSVIPNRPIAHAYEVWARLLPQHNGVVYRRSRDLVDTVLMVSRFYPELPGDLP